MAPNATVISYEWWDNVSELELEYNDAINNHGIDLSTNSWGFRRAFRSYGGYGEECSALDDVVRGSIGKAIPIVWAAGNNRPSGDNGEYDSISQPGTAKNIITVGAINSDDESMCWFSSWGPTDDGRIKPDVVAAGGETGCAGIVSTIPAGVFTDDFTNGVCPDICEGPGWAIPIAVSDGIDDFFSPYSNSIGPNNWLPACEGIWEGTSMATPAVSGSIALMLQEYRNTHDDIEPLPSTIKALLIHTAQDLGNPGPDYSYGYGRINVPDAVDMIRDDAACCNVIIENNISATGEMDNYTIEVPAGTSELKVTLVWDDYPGTPNAARTLVNDLDLIAIGPTACYYPWILNASDPSAPAFRGRDDINNVEQIVVPNPMPGTWIIRVNGTSVPEPIQNYSLVSSLPMKEEDMTDVEWSIEKGLCWLYHNQNPDGSWTYSGRVTEENVGLTAMATAAFLNYGIDENDPTVRKAIDWILSKQQADGKITNGWYHNYDTSLAVLALVATRNESYYDEIEKAVDFLIELQNDEGEGYTQDSPYYGGWPYWKWMWDWADLSNSQFTMLALHYAEQFNPNDKIVPDEVWDKAEIFVTRCQNREASNPDYNFYDDGGFIYQPGSGIWAGGRSYASMTAAGLWGLYTCGVSRIDGRVVDAWGWIENNYHIDQNYPIGNKFLYYYLYGLAKACVLWNVSEIGGHDWYQEMSEFLINKQEDDGHWEGTDPREEPDTVATCWALLALESKVIPKNTYLVFEVHSPADLHVYDPMGRHVGINYTTGGVDIEIPGANYSGPGTEPQIINITNPIAGTYRVKLVGREEGNYTYTVRGLIGDRVVSEYSYEGRIKPGEEQESISIVSAIAGAITIETNALPIADADGPYHGYVGEPITFNGTGSHDPDGTIVSYEWDLDDDGEFDDAFGPNPTKIWNIPYQGNIGLRVIDDKGAVSVDITVLTVIEDNIPPITTKTVGNPKYGVNDTWVTSHTLFNLTAEDNPGGTGVDKTYYRIWYKGSWTPWMEYKGNFTLSGECKHYLEYYSVDKAGNVEEVHNQTHYVDDSPPVTDLSYGSPYYTNGIEEWITTFTLIYLNATDLPECGCGVNHTYYRINNGTWIEYTGPFTINEECKHTIEWYSVDHLGNKEQIHSTVVNVDSSPPVTNSSIGKPYYRDERGEWITSNTSIYLDSTDYPECACGVKEIYYSYDNGTTWFVVNGSVALFHIPEECSHVVKWFAVDNLGNEEEIHERILNVDNSPPETTLVIEGHYSGSGTPDDPYRVVITPETKIYLNATDKPECGAVGVRNTYFRIRADGLITKWMSLKELEEKGNDIKFAIPKSIIDKGGPFYMDYYSDDLLGNRESVKIAVFYLQKMHYHLGYKGFIWSFWHSRYRLL